jgi:ribonuclease E
MAKRMLIDATHPEETRVVVQNGHRLEEFDFESSTKKQVKGNIYLAKITRVEPSLQAAFVDYGGNRHGFLAFSEIHPDYYRIPVSDRDSGDGEAPSSAGDAPAENGVDDTGVPLAAALPEPVAVPEPLSEEGEAADEKSPDGMAVSAAGPGAEPISTAIGETGSEPSAGDGASVDWLPWEASSASGEISEREEATAQRTADATSAVPEPSTPEPAVSQPTVSEPTTFDPTTRYSESQYPAEPFGEIGSESGQGADVVALRAAEESIVASEIGEFTSPEGELTPRHEGDADAEGAENEDGESESVEFLGGDEVEEVEEADAERRRFHPARHYKIQEVIKRRQIMLVQVAKEERGNKGAALTTYLSLAGRYCVLMPNTARGGGVSRKITSLSDRRRLKEILAELEIPEGMGVIVRTAGAERTKAEIKRDYEYLLRLWNEIRELTLKSTAPALIYEEGNLIKRAIRDLYTRDIDEVLVEGEEGYRIAKAFMRTLMPSHAKHVQPYRDPQISLFHRHQVESQIDAIHSPVAQLRSGGYVVINQTEALVAIDVNSGRSTRERNIEETALRTNLEAAEEIARQLRLRDLSGLIVIDFIDMEERRNQMAVERRLKEALKNDRARIQVGRISPFGLLEMSRQRLRPSLTEASTQPCPHCGGSGFIRSVESTALYVLRSIEEEGIRRRSAEICIYVPTTVALYILNQKRDSLAQIEARYGLRVMVASDDALIPPNFRLERLRAYGAAEVPAVPRSIQAPTLAEDDEEVVAEDEEVEAPGSSGEQTEAADREDAEEERGRKRRRRRRRRPDEARETRAAPAPATATAEETGGPGGGPARNGEDRDSDAERRRRRRGRRGGRVRGRREGAEPVAAETIEVVPPTEEERIQREAAEMPPLEPWPGDAGLETATMGPLAGDVVGSGHEHTQHKEPVATPAPTAESEEGVPFVSDSERLLDHLDSPAAAEASETERELEGAVVGASAQPGTAVSEAEPEPHSDDNVQTITEKPANPRRGWWTRLMNS